MAFNLFINLFRKKIIIILYEIYIGQILKNNQDFSKSIIVLAGTLLCVNVGSDLLVYLYGDTLFKPLQEEMRLIDCIDEDKISVINRSGKFLELVFADYGVQGSRKTDAVKFLCTLKNKDLKITYYLQSSIVSFRSYYNVMRVEFNDVDLFNFPEKTIIALYFTLSELEIFTLMIWFLLVALYVVIQPIRYFFKI